MPTTAPVLSCTMLQIIPCLLAAGTEPVTLESKPKQRQFSLGLTFGVSLAVLILASMGAYGVVWWYRRKVCSDDGNISCSSCAHPPPCFLIPVGTQTGALLLAKLQDRQYQTVTSCPYNAEPHSKICYCCRRLSWLNWRLRCSTPSSATRKQLKKRYELAHLAVKTSQIYPLNDCLWKLSVIIIVFQTTMKS